MIVIAQPPQELTFKAQCKTCAHLTERLDDGVTVMHCRATREPSRRRPRYCIDERDADGACGPGAALWRAA